MAMKTLYQYHGNKKESHCQNSIMLIFNDIEDAHGKKAEIIYQFSFFTI
jgi:hypothetical protein